MITIIEMDRVVSVRDQIGDQSTEPVTLVNIFSVAPEDVDALLAAWKDDANYFKAQPGFISTQLHRGIAGSCTFLNYAVWENVAVFRSAFGNPEFQRKLAAYPDSATASPHVFRKMAVEGLCVA